MRLRHKGLDIDAKYATKPMACDRQCTLALQRRSPIGHAMLQPARCALPYQSARPHANHILSASLRLLAALGSSVRSLYPHFADVVSGFHGKLVPAVQEDVAWPYQPEISAAPIMLMPSVQQRGTTLLLSLFHSGRDDKTRTCDLAPPRRVRYQLRYIPLPFAAEALFLPFAMQRYDIILYSPNFFVLLYIKNMVIPSIRTYNANIRP